MLAARRPVVASSLERFAGVWSRDYAKLFGIGISSNTMRWLETIALGVFVYELTGSAFLVGFVGFLRMAPMLLLGAVIGALADRLSRKAMMVATNATITAVYLVMATLVITDRVEFWQVSVGAFVAGTVWATDFPVRRTLVAETVRPDRIASAFGVDMASSNFSRVIGPLVGGTFLQQIGMEAVYLLGATMFASATVVASTISVRARGATPGSSRSAPTSESAPPRSIWGTVIADLRSGLSIVRADTILQATLIITVLMNLFAFPYQHMIPVIGAETLAANPTMVGLLLSAEGLGATLGALTIAARARPRHFTRVYVFASLSFLAIIIAFGMTPWYWAALPLLFVGGFGMAGFGTMQSIIVISSTRPEMRGRVLGVLAVAIGFGPLGALQVGWLASIFGANVAVVLIAVAGIALTAATVLVYRRFLVRIPRRGRPLPARAAR